MKYNKSEIMKAAWNLRKMSMRWVNSLSFDECLRRAWAKAKETIANTKKLASGLVKVINGKKVYLDRAVVACDGKMGWVVTGYTYNARKELKRAGFEFDPEARNWFTYDCQVAEYFV